MIRIVLVEPLYEFNIGMTARVMKNFGFKQLFIVNPRSLGLEAKKYAMHAHDVLSNAKIVTTLDEAINDADYVIGTTGIVGSERNIIRAAVPVFELHRAVSANGIIAILFGREDIGLKNEELKKCDLVATIPTSSEYPVLNLSHAVAITLYELTRGKFRIRSYKPASRIEREMIIKFFSECLEVSYLPKKKIEFSKYVLKRILGRSFISKKEASTLIGCFRKIKNSILKSQKQLSPQRKIS